MTTFLMPKLMVITGGSPFEEDGLSALVLKSGDFPTWPEHLATLDGSRLIGAVRIRGKLHNVYVRHTDTNKQLLDIQQQLESLGISCVRKGVGELTAKTMLVHSAVLAITAIEDDDVARQSTFVVIDSWAHANPDERLP